MQDYTEECERKNRLLDAFQALENSEKEIRRRLPKAERRYERHVRGWAIIDQIGTESLRLTMESGETLKVAASRAICEDIRAGDSLSILCGLRDRRWRILLVDVISSPWPSPVPDLNTALPGKRPH